MRQLTAALEAAPMQATRLPCIRVQVVNKAGGVVKQNWDRLYTGAETEYFHAVTAPGDGSLIRVRVTPFSDARKLYLQRVANPGPGSDFSAWSYTGQSDVLAVAAASNGAEVSIIWIKSNREIRRLKSTDFGANWGSPELLDYTQTTYVYGVAAAYKPNGDLAIFFAEQSVLYIKKCISGQWQAKIAWNKTTGNLSGIACAYDSDWSLLITGKDTAGNFKLWSLVFGDGGYVTADTWSALKEIATAPSGGEFSYKHPFLDKTDVFRCFFVEAFTGVEAYNRPFRSYTVPGTYYYEGLWREPVPFNLAAEYGLAIAHCGDYGWLSSPCGVWRALLDIPALDVTADVIQAHQELKQTGGILTVELKNDDGRYSSAGQGRLLMLDRGCQLELSPGYVTVQGEEYSAGQYYSIDSYEYVRTGSKAAFVIHARDGWQMLENWEARHQFRWNKTGDEFNLRDILAVVLARAGLKLTVINNSAALTGFFPDFTINPGNNGKDIVQKLLGYVPDKLYMEGNTAYLVNPQSGDNPVYSYGSGHDILESRYGQGAMSINRVQTEGWDPGVGRMIIVDSNDWNEINRLDDIFRHVIDRNLNTVAEVGQRGTALLRQSQIAAEESIIVVPVNCGQQLYDVVAVTDEPAGLSAAVKRVTGITLVYNPGRGEYFQRLGLGRV
jgi:hypothetical protein